MKGIERYNAVLKQERPDIIPIRIANYNMFACHYYGITIKDYLENSSRHAEVFVEFVKEFAFDSAKPALGYIFYGCGPEMGSAWDFPEGQFPGCVRGIIDTPDDVDKVVIPSEPGGYFKRFLAINRKVKAEIGKEVHLSISVLGPFSVMVFLRGLEKLLIDTLDDLNFFNLMMQKGAEISLFIGRHCLELGLPGNNLLEVFLTPGMIMPEFYDDHIAPTDKAVCRKLSDPPLHDTMGVFMGAPGHPERRRMGKTLNDYYFGTAESLDVLRAASEFMLPGFPRIVTLSGRALVNWPVERILAFIRKGLDFFVRERREYPSIFLASIQPPDLESAKDVAQKLRALNRLREEYSL